MRPILALLLIACAGWAVEVQATVDHVTDGDTIGVVIAGENAVAKVRLLWLDTPESKGNSHGEAMEEGKQAAEFARKLMPKGTAVRLWSPRADALEHDVYGRLLAVVYVGAAGDGPSVQEQVIASGWSPYWRKYGAAPEPLHGKLLTAQETAQRDQTGAWSTAAGWMRDKSNERTAPRR
jgi:endonuclease YncB( thermonuclease family)